MKKTRIFCLLALCLALSFLCGCSFLVEFLAESLSTPPVPLPETRFAAYSETACEPSELSFADAEALAQFTSEYEGQFLRTTPYFSALNEAEKLVYRLLERGFYEGKSYLYIDQRVTDACQRSLVEIVRFFSLDCPLMEQNFSYRSRQGLVVQRKAESGLGTYELPVVEIFVNVFTAEKAQKRAEAMALARAVADQAPVGSETETALYFYQYLTDNVRYQDGEGTSVEIHYLYDVFANGTANCDGFANAYSLLCALRGLSVFEKEYVPDEESDDAGHVWNAVRLDGDWYNVDCALSEDSARAEMECDILIRFAFSDGLQKYPCANEALLPPCEKDYVPVSFTLPTASDPAFTDCVVTAFSKGTRHYILFSLQDGEMGKSVLQDLANRLRSALSLIRCDYLGKAYFYLIQTD